MQVRSMAAKAWGLRIESLFILNIFLSCSHRALFYTIQGITVSRYFSRILNHKSLYGPVASGAGVGPTSEVCSFAMLVL